jgi:LPXTG-motif cell wall-anchored protein
MRRVVSSWRRRATMFAVAGVAVVAAAVTGVILLNTGPATAHLQSLSGTTTCDCVVKNTKTNEYRAVFGYDSTSRSAGKISLGANNHIQLTGADASSSSKIDGVQTTTFEPGAHRAAFATGWVSKDTQVTWAVGEQRASADWNKPTCGRDVSLPATGNGSGPLLALAASLLIAGGAIVLRKRRRKLRTA